MKNLKNELIRSESKIKAARALSTEEGQILMQIMQEYLVQNPDAWHRIQALENLLKMDTLEVLTGLKLSPIQEYNSNQ